VGGSRKFFTKAFLTASGGVPANKKVEIINIQVIRIVCFIFIIG
jgi:hypothetical protein